MDDATNRLRVMTWNVWWRFGDLWRERQKAIRTVIERVAPDIIGLQEVWGTSDEAASQAHELADQLDMYAAFAAPSLPAPPPDAVGEEVGVAILSRWPITRTEVRRVRSVHRKEIVLLAGEIANPRGPLHAVVGCTDYDTGASAERLAQTTALVEMSADTSRDGDLPVLAMGDLNAPPDTPEIRVAADRMTDAWEAIYGDREAGTTLRSSNPFAPVEAWQIDQRIDYIFGRPGREGSRLRFNAARTIDEPVDGVHPSDHAAVVVEIDIG